MRSSKFHIKLCNVLEQDLLNSNSKYKTLKFFRKNIVTVIIWLSSIKNFYNNEKNSVEDLVRRSNSVSRVSRPSVVSFINNAVSKGYLISEKSKSDKRKYNIIPTKITLKEFEKWSKIFIFPKN